ncbi:Phosphoribosylformylglycinamidine synthase, PurS subunit (EC / Phosphoribosylformylglycinamidine synthase, synthetase subunit (EC [Olavius algarvensis associated proteobacterium Delta 3]|nr:Phosphoribosylformylglycinamidine synthase, PurS subunit (EC / Phosphoribosylformylglycinamidine synthase, synthetase subunit (EC [Olavius algarvensis associated proteobacterium Delta 3]CAB5131906.1 Phosphoribosylformylglycinamidine synthase, PurS subunit (EC / Phosphoribosylformylglycinamidine synthase, synthetase subunit (EC [Olavius algarvensis associated proteobacterium Delta 3]
MPHRLEIALKSDLPDAEGEGLRQKAKDYFGLHLETVRTVSIVTLDADLSEDQLGRIREEIFTNPVIQVSSYDPLPIDFDWTIWVGFRPGVRDNPGATAVEAVEDLLGIHFGKDDAVYTSQRYCILGDGLSIEAMDRLAGELLANDIIQQWKIFERADWDPAVGIGWIIPRVILNHTPTVSAITVASDEALRKVSDERNLALNPADIPTIRSYFLDARVQSERSREHLNEPTDIELEYISQARSDHCNHNTFQGLFRYRDVGTGREEVVDSLFKTYIETPTRRLQAEKPWVVSVLWDNAGVGRFDDNHAYVITGETHNSPSNMEAYGGAITGIVGIYRDPMGTGKGSKLIMGSFGYCVGYRDYTGDLKPHLHPRRLLDGVIEGVRDGGNKSGIPTTFGQVVFHPGYMGKCLVFVTALGIMPALIEGEPADQKTILPGDLAIMCGGRVGKDGIHGVTAASETFTENTPAGHVQIGDPYTQKKMHDFLLETRDEGLIRFITDNGGGGLSSSIGESARFSNGCHVQLEKVPLKYDGLDQWEIWISESQERMTVVIDPKNLDRFMALSRKHGVESTVIGTYTDSGKIHITYDGRTCAYVELDLLTSGFPQWKFDAEWYSPDIRGLFEPVTSEPDRYGQLLRDLLSRPNVCSREWIFRQYDHEVQGGSVIKPLVGAERDIPSDAAVLRPVLDSSRGLAFAQALLPAYSRIDAYHMTTCTIDEAVRRLIAVGAGLDHIAGVDNFCWPNIQYDPVTNPDGTFKAAQLVRSCRALKDLCLAYGIPLLSGKDSMYVDGNLRGTYGETHKVSALETLQFSTTGVVDDISRCVTLDAKAAGDLVYVLGVTRDELGASEFYEHFGYLGKNVPHVDPDSCRELYQRLTRAIQEERVASAHGIYRGGLGVHLAMVAMGGNLGLDIRLGELPADQPLRNDILLFSESAGRFIVTVDPTRKAEFESIFKGLACACVGRTTEKPELTIAGTDGSKLLSVPVDDLKEAWKSPFQDL